MADFAPGAVLGGRFEVVGILGRGGMATVYLAIDKLRDARIALKVLHPHLANQSSMQARLRREVLASSRIRHKNALVAHELHELDGALAISMPLHPGRTLLDRVQQDGPFDAAALQRLAVGIAGALSEAHREGVVHRDVTPTNVLIDDKGEGVLTDFGLARLDDQRTATGTSALGTAGYAAPEVYQGMRADPRSDVYSLGVVLWFAATGRPPFDAPTPMGVLQRQMSEDVGALAAVRPDLPRHVAATIDAMLRREPQDRPQGASEVIEALQSGQGPRLDREPEAPTPIPGLTTGEWTVVITEHWEDRERRKQLRRARKRQARGGFEASVDQIVARVTTGVQQLLGLPDTQSPEQALARAVSRAAGLPASALVVPPEVLEKQFRLVEGVDEDTARILAQQASNVGFTAMAMPLDGSGGRFGPRHPLFGIFLAIVGLLFVISWFDGGSGSLFAIGPFFLVFFFVVPGLRQSQQRHQPFDRMPVAYRHDLRPYLAEVHAHLGAALAPPRREQAPVQRKRTEETRRPANAPAAVDPVLALVERTQARLDDLLDDVNAGEGRMADAIVRDVRSTVEALREKAVALGDEAVRAKAAIARTDDTAELTAANRVEARLERLRTLQRAGERVDPREMATLERSLAAHRESLAAIEEHEVRLTRMMGELLEIGAAAGRVQRQLRNTRDPAYSAERLLDQLRQESDAASRALREVDDRLPREALPESGFVGAARAARRERTR